MASSRSSMAVDASHAVELHRFYHTSTIPDNLAR
jgi:hypothetical protein